MKLPDDSSVLKTFRRSPELERDARDLCDDPQEAPIFPLPIRLTRDDRRRITELGIRLLSDHC